MIGREETTEATTRRESIRNTARSLLPFACYHSPNMRALAMLRRRHILTLWLGQLLSATGDYFYSIAVTWIAAHTDEGAAGLVVAVQSGAALAAGFVTSAFIDRWNRRHAMMVADLVRALAIATLPYFAHTGHLDLTHLVAVALVVGSFDSVFVPALHASVPALVSHPGELQATNALMDATRRIARAVGPSLAGLLAAYASIPSFFTVDALSFAASALTLVLLANRHAAFAPEPRSPESLREASEAGRASRAFRDVALGFRLVRGEPAVFWSLSSVFVVNIAWCSGFFVGAALFASHVLTRGIASYGLIIAAYGVGNVTSNLVFGHFPSRRPVLSVFAAKVVLALGFGLLAVSPSLPLAMVAAAIAAVGGPMGDLPILSLLQTRFAASHRGRVFAIRHMAEQAGVMIGFLLAGPLFTVVTVRVGIGLAAGVLGLTGLGGLLRFRGRGAHA